ncbi:MAG: hypothetical protein ACYTXA_21080 [Nostoc sp.]
MPRRGNTLKITCSDRGNEFLRCVCFAQRRLITYKNNMTTTVLELIKNLKHHTDQTVVTIKDVDDVEFAIVDFILEANGLSIVIGEKVESEEEGI